MAFTLSGQITVTTAGTAVSGPDQVGQWFHLVAHPDNTDTVWIGNDNSGDVTKDNGYPLEADGAPITLQLANLNQLRVDAEVDGEKVCWIRMV